MQKNCSKVYEELSDVKDRIQGTFVELKESRERKKRIDDWMCSFMHPDQIRTNKEVDKLTQQRISVK